MDVQTFELSWFPETNRKIVDSWKPGNYSATKSLGPDMLIRFLPVCFGPESHRFQQTLLLLTELSAHSFINVPPCEVCRRPGGRRLIVALSTLDAQVHRKDLDNPIKIGISLLARSFVHSAASVCALFCVYQFTAWPQPCPWTELWDEFSISLFRHSNAERNQPFL